MSGFYGAPIGAVSVAITAGCNQAYCLAMQVLCAPGDEVILFDPAYDSYEPSVRMAGGRGLGHNGLNATNLEPPWTPPNSRPSCSA